MYKNNIFCIIGNKMHQNISYESIIIPHNLIKFDISELKKNYTKKITNQLIVQ